MGSPTESTLSQDSESSRTQQGEMPGPRGTSEDTDSRMKPGTSTENGINIVKERMSEQRCVSDGVTKLCQTLATPWIVICQDPLSMEFFRQEYWSGLPFPFPRDLPGPRIESMSPELLADSLPLSLQGSPNEKMKEQKKETLTIGASDSGHRR